eukprot:6213564-Pleurochrysis_carterae.AAC.5
MKRQFPRWGRKSRHMVCVLKASSSARSASRAPLPPFAAASHVIITASSCACGRCALVSPGFLSPIPSPLSLPVTPVASHLLSPCLGEELVCAPGLLRTIFPQSFAVFAVRARTQLAPSRLLVENECSSHRVVCARCVCFPFERAFVVLRVKSETRGSPFEFILRRCGVPKFTLVRCRAGAHAPHIEVQLLHGVNHDSLQVLSLLLRAPVFRVLPRLPHYILNLFSHYFIPFRGCDVKEPSRHRWKCHDPCPCLRSPPSPHPGYTAQTCLILRAAPERYLPYSPPLCVHLISGQRPPQAFFLRTLRRQ